MDGPSRETVEVEDENGLLDSFFYSTTPIERGPHDRGSKSEYYLLTS